MPVKGLYTIMGSLAIHLNDSLTDPVSSTRVGSYAFGPDMEINTKKYMPKIQITDLGIAERDDYSFGGNPKRNESPLINILFYCKRGDKYTESDVIYQNRNYVYLFLSKIEDMLGSSTGSFIGATTPRFGAVDRIAYDRNQQVYVGALPLTYTYRR